MKKTNKIILSLGTVAATIAPIAAVVSCGGADINRKGGIFTEYVRAHDLVLSLGVSPAWHARSDISSTHNLTNEGYLDHFSNDFTANGKRYNGGDSEYFASLGIGMYIGRSISDSKGYFTHVDKKVDIKNSDAPGTTFIKDGKLNLNWKEQIAKIVTEFDKATSSTKYSTRKAKIISAWDIRETKLREDAHSMTAEKKVLLVRGSDDETIFGGIIPSTHTGELYGLDNISMPNPVDSSKITAKSYLISGKGPTNKNADLLEGYKNVADVVIYLKTPSSTASDSDIKNAIKGFTKGNDATKVLVRTYDKWYLPFRGAAIGANVAMDNIEKDIIKNTNFTATNWKDLYKSSDLINLKF